MCSGIACDAFVCVLVFLVSLRSCVCVYCYVFVCILARVLFVCVCPYNHACCVLRSVSFMFICVRVSDRFDAFVCDCLCVSVRACEMMCVVAVCVCVLSLRGVCVSLFM